MTAADAPAFSTFHVEVQVTHTYQLPVLADSPERAREQALDVMAQLEDSARDRFYLHTTERVTVNPGETGTTPDRLRVVR